MATRIEVTAEDIAAGKRTDCRRCPVAIAATRTFGRPVRATLERLVDDETNTTLARLPDEAWYWMHQFDCDHEALPFAFEV